MKSYAGLSLLLMALAFILIGCEPVQNADTKVVKTNYYDLPAAEEGAMKALLKTDDLSVLRVSNIKALRDTFNCRAFKGNPLNKKMHTSYFWYIYNPLPDFVDSKERHHGYYMHQQKKYSAQDRRVAYAIYRIDRSPSNLKRGYAFVKPIIRQVLPSAQFNYNNAGEILRGLLDSYDAITSVDGYTKKFDDFWDRYYTSSGAMRTDNPKVKEEYDTAYGFSSSLLAEHLSAEFGFDRYNSMYGSLWLSFWMRRHHEGNMDVVHDILLDIAKMYNVSL